MLISTNLTRWFGDHLAVENASLTLEPGQIFALLGPNGAGKTTTLRMLAGLIEPSSGSVTVNGRTISRRTAAQVRGNIGFLTEAPGLWDRLTVRQNLEVYARLYGVPHADRVVSDTLALFGLSDRARQLAAQLSKGLKQRVALARTLLHKPDVVLLDEPTSGLDPESARDVRGLVLQLRDEGCAVLLSTHHLDEVERIADRVAVLRTRMIAVDTPAALRARLFGSRLRIVMAGDASPFIGVVDGTGISAAKAEGATLLVSVDNPSARAPALVRRLVSAGADILSVVPDEASLEEVYMRLLEDEAHS
jgi:ABC-2 type transport system ATP-binding protein